MTAFGDSALPARRRAVIVAVGSADQRATVPAQCASRIQAEEHRAVHVATDAADSKALDLWWIDAQPNGLALEVVEDRGGVAATVAAQVQTRLSTGFDEAIVLIGHLSMRRGRRLLFHDRSAQAICAAVDDIPGAVGLLVPVEIPR